MMKSLDSEKGWQTFYSSACPQSLLDGEANRGMVWRCARWLGVRVAFVFYKLNITANMIGYLRVILSIVALYLMTKLLAGNVFIALYGFVLLVAQVFLDFVDGSVARNLHKPSLIGERWDGLANALSRSIVFILFGIFTNSIFMIILSAAISYVLVGFIPITTEVISDKGLEGLFKKAFAKTLSVVFVLIVLPASLLLASILDFSLTIYSYLILAIYGLLTTIWLGLCVRK